MYEHFNGGGRIKKSMEQAEMWNIILIFAAENNTKPILIN